MEKITELDAHSRRVLGALLEKEQATPDYYPLSINSLVSACNQTTNRDPVLNLKRHEVLAALHKMERLGMVQRVTGPRVDRWAHLLIQPVYAEPRRKALLTLLLLRGPQTPGELKGRSERLYRFESLQEVEESMRQLVEEGLVGELPRQPGQKERRWILLSGEGVEEIPPEEEEAEDRMREADEEASASLEERVRRLEVQVAELMERLSR